MDNQIKISNLIALAEVFDIDGQHDISDTITRVATNSAAAQKIASPIQTIVEQIANFGEPGLDPSAIVKALGGQIDPTEQASKLHGNVMEMALRTGKPGYAGRGPAPGSPIAGGAILGPEGVKGLIGYDERDPNKSLVTDVPIYSPERMVARLVAAILAMYKQQRETRTKSIEGIATPLSSGEQSLDNDIPKESLQQLFNWLQQQSGGQSPQGG